FLIDDGGGGIDREPVTLTVEHVDRKPEIDPLTAQTVAEQQELSLKVSGTELDAEDQNRISFRMVNLPQGASFNASTQEFSWTPSYEQSGTFNNIMAIMQAGALSDTTIFAITVTHVNRAPSLVDIPAKFVDENAQISFVVDGSDPDKEDMGQLTFTASNLPEGATFTLTNRTFTWTPTYEQSGVYNTIEFSITDPQGLSDRKSVSITVNHVNRPPSIAEVPNQTTNENLPIAVQLSATDPDREDSGQLTFSANGLPEGATLDPQSGIFNWTPTYDQSGSYAITFSISDGEFTDSTPMTIAVTHVNRPPVLAQLSPQSVDENTGLTFTISGSDDDVEDAGKLVFSATKLPEGATFDPAARRFSWTPTFEQSGTYQVAFTVQDPSDLSNTQEVTITVNHVNRPPVLAAVPALTVDENTPLAFQLAGSDPDKEDAGKLSYEVNGIPENASVVPNSGAVSWTPTYDQSGAFALTAYVRDPAGLSAQQPVSIVVNNVNRPPKFGLATAQNGEESIPLSFTISASDPDGEDEGKLVYSAEGLPRGASIDRRTGAVTWTPDFEQSGDYQISLKVTDSFGETDQADVAISIAHVNRPPVLPIVGTQTFSENVAREVTLPAGSDPDQEDANRLTYRLDLLPAGATFNPATRVLAWTPTFEQAGSYQVNYVISDGSAEDVKNFSLEVANVNRPAKFAALPAQSAQENQAISFTVSAVDPDPEDSGKLTFSSGNLPQGASLDGSSGVFNWTPSFDQGGTYDINFTVRDGAGATDQTQVSIAVMEVNRAPELGQVSEISFQENQRASITLPAGSDADPKDRTSLSYRVDGLPAGASFDAMSRQLTWEPSFDQAGTYSVRYVVSDGSGESSVNVSITVVNVNRPPSVSVPGDQDIRVAQPLNFQISGSDPDPEDNGKLNYEVQGLPEGAIFDNRSGQFSWIPGPDQIGKFAVTFVVKDGSGMTGTAKVTINVSDATTAP
nr:putative Ig domain-containing protein [Calditrichia bacterium]